MPAALSTLPPADAWQPLPATAWDAASARHLLQRIGWTATPAATARALRDGPRATLERCFARMPEFPKPTLIAELEEDSPEMTRKPMAPGDESRRRLAARDARERAREALIDLTLRWLRLAAQPENSPAEKWLLFLSDVWVVSIEKVRNTALIYRHQDVLRRFGLGPAPALAKAVSRSPAMIMYLDLQQSGRAAPNENFARELFELFTLGEGNYTEDDIKQAARAFTGYRQRAGEFLLARRQHDDGVKTLFGQRGRFSGDDVMDLVFRQQAAGTFLPKEMVRFYLSDTPLPPAYTDALGAAWAAAGFDLRQLVLTFFGSRAFFAADFRDNFIKSPVQFYLGLLQDLDLEVAPVARRVIGALRQMGQLPFDPPNVRGWVGGRAWINSATLAGRRQVVQGLLRPIDRDALNADEVMELTAAESAGPAHFTLDDKRLLGWARLAPASAAAQLVACSLPGRADRELQARLVRFLQAGAGRPAASVRTALAALLDSPDYQLC